MNAIRGSRYPRARHLLVAATFASAVALSLAPYGPAPVVAADPSPAPSDVASPDPGATPTPIDPATPAPSDSPVPLPTPAPTDTAAPTDPVTPSATPAPSDTPAPTGSPAVTDAPSPGATDTPGETPPTLDATPSLTDTPSPTPSDSPSESPSDSPSPSPSPSTSPTAGIVTLEQSSTAHAAGRHRVDPGSHLLITLSIHAETEVTDGALIETLPAGWRVRLTSGGLYDPVARTVSWHVQGMTAGDDAAANIDLVAPDVPVANGALVIPATFSGRFVQGDVVDAAPDLDVIVAPRVALPHYTETTVDGEPPTTRSRAADAIVTDLQRYRVLRVRFEVRNPDSVATSWTPRLEFRRTDGSFAAVPAGESVDAIPVYAAPEWVPSGDPAGGTMLQLAALPLTAAALTQDGLAAEGQDVVDGLASRGVNPLPAMVLPPDSVTAIEFSVRATSDAAYESELEFRLTDGGTTFAGAVTPDAWLGPAPPVALSAGQRAGEPADDAAARSGSGTTEQTATAAAADAALAASPPPLQYPLDPSNGSVQYPLVTADAPAQAGPTTPPDPIHGPDSLTTDACAACHGSHTAQGTNLITKPAEYALCTTCHDGTTANGGPDIVAGYAAAPTNDPASRSYYQHDPTQVAGHTSVATDILAGVSNRHNECADCHDPHRSTASLASPDPSGWTAAGAIAGAAGVAVVNGPAGAAPSYNPVQAVTAEYQLCFRCHSGYTVLPDNTDQPPSRYALDKGVEFNPANLSYHPIEAPGTNTTPEMAGSLTGTSPYKLWDFTTGSTIRCVNCHADSRTVTPPAASPDPDATPDPSPTPTPTPSLVAVGADASLPVHSSENRGILLQPYLDRSLKPWTEAYSAADFALCYLCHAEAPFVDTSGNVRSDTNFRYHGLHVSGVNLLGHGSPSTEIDTAGAGGGLATCAECHFRIHSTTYAVPGQSISGERLVNFAPDVVSDALSSTLGWTAKTATQAGSCTLTCHGQPHRQKTY